MVRLWVACSGDVRQQLDAYRHCHKLAYSPQREQVYDRASSEAGKLLARLVREAGILNGNGRKPTIALANFHAVAGGAYRARQSIAGRDD